MASPGTIVGRTLGHYRIVEQIGAGGMGVVYRAYDERLERDVALKILPPGTLAQESAKKRFHREALTLSKLNHPNIATIHDFDTNDGVEFLVMEYIPGTTLSEILHAGALPEKDVISLGTQLADGLSAAHEHGVIHRDVKPGNVRVTADGRLKIMDFGLAMINSPTTATGATQSVSDATTIVGTLPYMAPEQLLGGEADARTDVHAAGLVLYEMATGQRPYAEIDQSNLIGAILGRLPRPAIEIQPKLSMELERIISKCVDKEPRHRYQSAKELADDLRRMSASSTETLLVFPRIRIAWARNTAAFMLAVATLVTVGLLLRSRHVQALAPSDTVVLADFVNSTKEPVFDEALSQALTVELEQSPFLKILPLAKRRDTLRLMGRSPDETVTPEIGRELCQRAAGKAVLWGSISSLGGHYVIGLTAAECSTGNYLANEQIQSIDKENVLKALGKAASRLRGRLGESLTSVQKFDAPLEYATTPSLDALKAYSLGIKAEYTKGSSAAVPFFKRAVEIDPNFAVAYSALGIVYSNLGEPGLANQNFERAYELRDRVSELEKLRIAASYYSYVEGDLVKGRETYELWAQAYPNDAVPHGNLGVLNFYLGQYDESIAETVEHLRTEPDEALGYGNLVVQYAALNRFQEAKAVYQQAMARGLEELSLHANRYGIAFLDGDAAEMERQVAWATGKPGAEDVLLSLASDTEAFYGHLSKARGLSSRAVDTAGRNDQKETAAGWQMNAALREAEFGNLSQARKTAQAALRLASTRDARILGALVFARTGDLSEAQRMATELAKEFPRDTLIVGYWLPTISAAIEINRGNPAKAVELLRAATPYELGEPYPMFQVGGSLYPVYLRGQAFLLLHRGREAASEFQKILDHRGIVMNCPFGALSHLGLARAYAMQSQLAKSRSAYQDFFTLWKDADSDIPILKQATREYAALGS